MIGLFDQVDCGIGSVDLPDEDAGEYKTSDDREDHCLPEGPLESFEFQSDSSFFRVGPDSRFPGYLN